METDRIDLERDPLPTTTAVIDRKAKRTTDAQPTCHGDCLDIERLIFELDLASDPDDTSCEDKAAPDTLEHSIQLLYNVALTPGQTRLIRLAPFADRDDQHVISLMIAEAVVIEGVRLTSTSEVVQYTALSYCWNAQDRKDTITIDGHPVSLPTDVVSAIEHHRSPDSTVYLWIDAVCINQKDPQEKARQVSMMMDIYLKAQSVTAWLGPSDSHSMFALSCIRGMGDILPRIHSRRDCLEHTQDCAQSAHRLLTSLVAFYERPYLSRTWIRQEIFAARQINVVCGKEVIQWNAYLTAGRELLRDLYEDPAITVQVLKSRYARIQLLLAQASTSQRSSIWPQPRDLADVLLTSPAFGVTLEVDTIYAILQMCGIDSSVGEEWHPFDRKFPIDYTLDSSRVYHRFAMWTLVHHPRLFLGSWDLIVRDHDSDMPSWVVHWHQSRCTDVDFGKLDNSYKYQDSLPESDYPHSFWRQYVEDVVPSRQPCVSPTDDRLLELQGQAVNYVAYVSDFSCSLDDLVRLQEEEWDYQSMLGKAGAMIHLHEQPDAGESLFDFPPDAKMVRFDPGKDDRRVVILGYASRWQFALVPAHTKKGDLVVAVSSWLLPMILSPITQASYTSRLYQDPDPYDRCPLQVTTQVSDRETMSELVMRWTKNPRFVLWFLGILLCIIASIPLSLMARQPDTSDSATEASSRNPLFIAGMTIACCAWLCIILAESTYCWPVREQPCDTPLLDLRNKNLDVLGNVTRDYDLQYRLVGPALIRHRTQSWPWRAADDMTGPIQKFSVR